MAESTTEIRYQVGEAWKGTYNAQTVYNVAAVVQDPTGLSVYRSLKSGNVGHPLSNRTWWFLIIDLSSIKTESDRISALNTALAQDEQQRVAAEQGRVNAEAGRVAAENGRVSDERTRVSKENQRQSAESSRISNENTRTTKESQRQTAETGRVDAENGRVSAENLRDSAESDRVTSENSRVAAENQRNQQFQADHDLSVELNTHQPRINTDTGCWEYWNPETDQYVDSGVMAMASPYATFEINPETGQLEVETADTYAGPTFSLDQENGNLEITI